MTVKTYSKVLLSGSTDGKPISITTTGSPGTLLHTAVSGTSSLDELYAYFANKSSSSVNLTIQFGGTTTGDYLVSAYPIPANSPPIPLVTGQLLQNSNVVRAFASATGSINATGFANRIS